MSVAKIFCKTCSNRVGKDHCTRSLAMKVSRYKHCKGYKKYVPKPKPVEEAPVIKREKFDPTTPFGKFVLKGGRYSFRTNEYQENTR